LHKSFTTLTILNLLYALIPGNLPMLPKSQIIHISTSTRRKTKLCNSAWR